MNEWAPTEIEKEPDVDLCLLVFFFVCVLFGILLY